MKPVLYRYRDSESVIKPMEGYTPGEGWEQLYSQAQVDSLQAQLVRQQASYEAEIKIEVEAERERCAKVCEAFANERYSLYKGRPPYTGQEPGRFSDFVQGQSDGADQCADAIRKGE